MGIFDGVHYHLAESLPSGRRLLIARYLDLNGGQQSESGGLEGATHVITNTSQFEGWRKVEDGTVDVAVITVRLVTLVPCLGAYFDVWIGIVD
jgi:hypothetical protein